eukprot:263482-Hanusia_phi.AAC.2
MTTRRVLLLDGISFCFLVLSLGSGSANIYLSNDGNLRNKQECNNVLRLRGGVMWVGGGKTFNRFPPLLLPAPLPSSSSPPPRTLSTCGLQVHSRWNMPFSRIVFFVSDMRQSHLFLPLVLKPSYRTHDPSASPEDVEDTFAPLRSRSESANRIKQLVQKYGSKYRTNEVEIVSLEEEAKYLIRAQKLLRVQVSFILTLLVLIMSCGGQSLSVEFSAASQFQVRAEDD